VTAETRIYLRDVADHTRQAFDIIESHREIATSVLDMYISLVSQRLNEVMKVLTIIATIFIPLSFVAGLYGMNFNQDSKWNMPELNFTYGYPMALGIMLACAIVMLVYFRRKGWFK
ncbi:MAG: magnesium and cobalt transport protein CorA, partial [Candidatus Eisenbacteria bacterium]|nr:magnesium and cobalt transport protein CorA [Candidatus Eisenbacteria bacterium]